MSFRGSLAILVNNSAEPPNGKPIPTATVKPALLSDDLGTKQAKVIMDYDAVLPQEISVSQNDILIVYRLPGMDAEYVMAEKGGKRGKLPVSYIELL
uniref:SH3 domain-containing protein n=1 Tax=Caenorhabditis japonica TaxID=281687 RepID=A0A8R1IR57_CAEJA